MPPTRARGSGQDANRTTRIPRTHPMGWHPAQVSHPRSHASTAAEQALERGLVTRRRRLPLRGRRSPTDDRRDRPRGLRDPVLAVLNSREFERIQLGVKAVPDDQTSRGQRRVSSRLPEHVRTTKDWGRRIAPVTAAEARVSTDRQDRQPLTVCMTAIDRASHSLRSVITVTLTKTFTR